MRIPLTDANGVVIGSIDIDRSRNLAQQIIDGAHYRLGCSYTTDGTVLGYSLIPIEKKGLI